MSTHNLCFGAKIRKIGIPLRTAVFLCKSGVKGVCFTRICFRDGTLFSFHLHFDSNLLYKLCVTVTVI